MQNAVIAKIDRTVAEESFARMTEQKSVIPHIDLPRAVARALINGGSITIDGNVYRMFEPGAEFTNSRGEAVVSAEWQILTKAWRIRGGEKHECWLGSHMSLEDFMNVAARTDGAEREALFQETFLANAEKALTHINRRRGGSGRPSAAFASAEDPTSDHY